MSSERLDRFLTRTAERIAGCVCWIGDNKTTFFFKAYGYSQIIPEKTKLNKNTIFDLASITKPLVTAMSIMQLYEKKQLQLGDRIRKYLEEFKNKTNGEKTIKELLTHTSGIPAWFPLYILPKEKDIDYLSETNTGKDKVIYSCLGYIILGKIIEVVAGCSLDTYFRNNIKREFGFKNTGFGPVNRTNIAATENGNAYEKKTAFKHGKTSKIKWRDYVIKGEVHDGNSFYAYNGVSGNAGLFSNAKDLVKITRHFCAGDIVKSKTFKMMIKDHTGGRDKRGLGWVVNPYPGILSSSTFYHTGFTGTMLLVDPDINLIVILLANAVHPRVRLGLMPKIRKEVARLAIKIVRTKK